MRTRVVAVHVGLILTVARAGPSRAVDDLAAQERLGGRVGYVQTFDELNTYYGDGWDLTLYFNERLHQRLVLDVRIGATYLGDVLDPELDDEVLSAPGVETEMRVFYFSVGLMYGIPLASGNYTLTSSLAAGIYSVSIAYATDFEAGDFSDQYFGANGGLGVVRRLGTSFSLDVNATVHYFDTDDGDIYALFTDGDEDPILLGLSLGVVFDLR